MSNKITVKSSSSPSGGGCVRVYVGTQVTWMRRVDSVSDLLRIESEVKKTLANRSMSKERRLRLL